MTTDTDTRTWDDLTSQEQEDLTDWNHSEPDDEDRARLVALLDRGDFAAWNCPLCENRVYFADLDDDDAEWDHFQGVLQADFCSYPGDLTIWTEDFNSRLCDNCRAHPPGYGVDLHVTGTPPFTWD